MRPRSRTTVEIDLTGYDVGDSIHISAVTLPQGATSAITDRDFTIATVVAPSGMRGAAAAEGDGEGETPAEG
jgi:large subunit ribosomal protein L25